jgi:pyruvate ferredoxin oxidoreductase beta subunit/2-oxoisovalerate ferredoxin oxidoreductase beta subunit
VPEDQGIHAARLAVQSGVFPLYEVEGGVRYTLNDPPKTLPVRDYLGLQRRYQDLGDAEIEELQREVDAGWARLQERAQSARG